MEVEFFHNQELPGETRSLDITAKWVEAVHCRGQLTDTLSDLAQMVRGGRVQIIRCTSQQGSIKRLAIAEPDHPGAGVQQDRSFAFDLMGEMLHAMRVGAVQSFIEAEQDGLIDRDTASDLRSKMSAYRIADIVLVRLSSTPDNSDYLEVHFDAELSRVNRNLMVMIAGVLSRTWQAREPGLAEAESAKLRFRNARRPAGVAEAQILDLSNPLSLSRCEFRVCMLVKEGMVVKSIARTLGVRDSTVRSHLRSIYMKTDTSCHIELLHRLNREAVNPGGSTFPPIVHSSATVGE